MKKKVFFAIVICTIVAILGGYYNNHKQFDVKEIERKIALEDNTVEENETEDVVIISPGDTIPSEIKENTKLLKGEYYLNNSLVIEENATLTIEAGSTLKLGGITKQITITVNGTLRMLGNENETANLLYNYGTDWSSGLNLITISETGKMETSYAEINNIYAENRLAIHTVINNKGETILHHTKITSNHPNFYYYDWIRNDGSLKLTENNFSGKVQIKESSSNVLIEDNILRNGVTIDGYVNGVIKICNNNVTKDKEYPISVVLDVVNENTFTNIINNHNVTNELYDMIELKGNLVGNVKLTKQNYKLVNNITVPENSLLEMQSGTNLLKEGKSIRLCRRI